MKRSRFTETQIISILSEVDAGLSVKKLSASTASVTRPTTTGRSSAAA